MSKRTILLHCNAGGAYGMGHCMRVLALAEESTARGWRVHIVGDLSENAVNILASAVPQARLYSADPKSAPGELMRVALAESVDVVHLDTYWGDFDDLVGHSWIVSNMQDGPFGVRSADVVIDANIGAEAGFEVAQADARSVYLVGGRAAIVRRQVRRHAYHLRQMRGDTPRKVLIVIGGTDPRGLTPQIIRQLDAVSSPLEVTVVTTSSASAVRDAARLSAHAVTVVPFAEDLPGLAVSHDLVISAAGTSVLDFACMGVPMALVCVTENQLTGYERVTSQGIALPLGFPPADSIADRVEELQIALERPEELRRLSERGRGVVDGLGVWRITAAWESLSARRPAAPAGASGDWTSREATLDDAKLLFEWRNDEGTRVRSRSTGELDWNSHIEWLELSVASTQRRLLIVENEHSPVGTVRWDRVGDDRWEISITVAPRERGQGRSAAVLAMGEQAMSDQAPVTLVADIHTNNHASLRLFAAAGYTPDRPADPGGFLTFAKQLL